MMFITTRRPRDRRGAIVVMAALFLIVFLAMLAFAIDVGYLDLTKTQLQSVADSAALAGAARICQNDMTTEAQKFAKMNTINGQAVQIASGDVQSGLWSPDANNGRGSFTPSNSTVNAVKVTARTNANNGITPYFFASIWGASDMRQSASAVATVNPRDIVFVVDLSASMNYDTRPDRSSSSVSEELIQKVYDDFNFGTYPGTSQYAGYPLTKQTSGSDWLTRLKTALGDNTYKGTLYFTGTKKTSGWTSYYVDSDGVTTLSESTRNKRAYSWVMDVQIGQQLMPNALPKPDSTNTTSYNYWVTYITDPDSATEGSLPFYKRIGYSSYVQFMMYYGRDEKPGNACYTPLSINSSNCLYHTEATDGGNFSFPAREQPTHASRRSIIAALQVVKERNQNISNTNQKDWVSIITYDTKSAVVILQGLTDDYNLAMQKCTTMQACASGGACTYTEGGLIAGRNLIKAESDGGTGRKNVNKVVVLLTDGVPNLRYSSNSTINNYVSANPSGYFYPGVSNESAYCKQASLMQASTVQADNWYVFPIGIGLSVDTDFMDRMANIAGTADKDGHSASSTDPSTYEEALKEIFKQIITRPKLRLVQ